MKIYVASYTSPCGIGYQKIFTDKKSANGWMYKKFVKEYCTGYGNTKKEKLELFEAHKRYGAFSGKIKQFNIHVGGKIKI